MQTLHNREHNVSCSWFKVDIFQCGIVHNRQTAKQDNMAWSKSVLTPGNKNGRLIFIPLFYLRVMAWPVTGAWHSQFRAMLNFLHMSCDLWLSSDCIDNVYISVTAHAITGDWQDIPHFQPYDLKEKSDIFGKCFCLHSKYDARARRLLA